MADVNGKFAVMITHDPYSNINKLPVPRFWVDADGMPTTFVDYKSASNKRGDIKKEYPHLWLTVTKVYIPEIDIKNPCSEIVLEEYEDADVRR